jgi:hypothetical protein
MLVYRFLNLLNIVALGYLRSLFFNYLESPL